MQLRSKSYTACCATSGQCNVYLGKSTICDGLGVFAKRGISAETYITKYDYIPLPVHPDYIFEDDYAIRLRDNSVRFGNFIQPNVQNGIAQMVNDALCECITNKKNNARFKEINGQIILISERFIHSGEEIFVHYGWEYWSSRLDRFFISDRNKLEFHYKLYEKTLSGRFRCDVMACKSHAIYNSDQTSVSGILHTMHFEQSKKTDDVHLRVKTDTLLNIQSIEKV